MLFPVEFLNSIELTGLPEHELKLKIGTPIILLRNIKPPVLMNGIRLIIVKLSNNLIEAKIINGPNKGKIVLIPKIPIISSDTMLPFQFKRL